MTETPDVAALMSQGPVIPVLTIEDPAHAAPLANALVAGGLRVLEVTLRSSAALESIRLIAESAPEAIVGAGTVLNARDFDRAIAAGARFIVTPGLTEALIAAASASQTPVLPGVATASEVMRGIDAGLTHFKFFPAEAAGGAAVLNAFYGPFAACRFCPTGGINPNNAPAYLALPNVLCVGGAWVAPQAEIRAGDWARITALATEAANLRPVGRAPV